MKTAFIKIAIAMLALASVPAFTHHASASSILIDDWYGINNTSPVPDPAPIILNGNTITPDYQNIIGNNIWVFSYFDSTTVLSGQKLMLEFDLTLNLTQATQEFTTMTFGLFNSSTPHATTSSFGADRVATTSAAGNTVKGWEGFILKKRSQNAWHPFEVYRKTGDPNVNFVGHDDADITQSLGAGTGTYSLNFTNNVARSFTFTLERIGDDLIFSGSVGTGMNFVETTISNGFLGGYNVFDAFGFYASGGSAAISNAQFTDVSLQLVPEPSITALLLVTLAALGIRRCRRV